MRLTVNTVTKVHRIILNYKLNELNAATPHPIMSRIDWYVHRVIDRTEQNRTETGQTARKTSTHNYNE